MSHHHHRSKLIALACAVAALITAAAAFGRANSVHISLHPNTGKYGSVYKIVVSGYAARADEQLALTMVTLPSKPCAASYTKGFSEQSGLANAAGKPMGPRAVPKGAFHRTVGVKITTSDPGAFGICAYLQVGSATKAHAASVLTITQ